MCHSSCRRRWSSSVTQRAQLVGVSAAALSLSLPMPLPLAISLAACVILLGTSLHATCSHKQQRRGAYLFLLTLFPPQSLPSAAADDNSIKSCSLSLCVLLSASHVVRSHFYCRHCFGSLSQLQLPSPTPTQSQSLPTHTRIHTHSHTAMQTSFVPFLSLFFTWQGFACLLPTPPLFTASL